MTSSPSTQAQIQGMVLGYPKIYIICQLLEHMKMLVLPIQNFKISLTHGNEEVSW